MRSRADKPIQTTGFYLAGFVSLVLAVLKLTVIVDWSWRQVKVGALNSPPQDHQLMTQGEKLQREFGSAYNQATNEDENDLAERHLASTHEVFSVGGVWKEITLTARRK